MGLAVRAALVVSFLVACSSSAEPSPQVADRPVIVVTHAILGTVVREVVGPAADVVVLIPNGVDPHVYEPSAKDIEVLHSARLVVVNGLGLEPRLEDSLRDVRSRKIPIFTATEHIRVDDSGESRLLPDDPHFWTNPEIMAGVVEDLGKTVFDLGLDIGDRALMFSERLLTFDQKMVELVGTLPENRRLLITGHESLGYFADHYGFRIVGTILPGLTSGSEVSAGNLAAVKEVLQRSKIGVVFTELGTPSAAARVLSDDLGVRVVEISTHFLSDEARASGMSGDSYMKFIEILVSTIVSALAQ